MIGETEVAPRSGVEETRLRIFAATRELYAAKGSKGTTTREVAERAGVNEATLFRHFGTKQQLLAAMLDHYSTATNFAEMLEHLRRLDTIEEQLRAIARAAIENLRRKEDLIKISMAEEIANPHGVACAWRAPTEARRRLTEYFAEQVSAGTLSGEPAWLARAFMSLYFSLVMARGIWDEEAAAPDRAVDILVELFLNGARAR